MTTISYEPETIVDGWIFDPAANSWFARLPGNRWVVVEGDLDDPPRFVPGTMTDLPADTLADELTGLVLEHSRPASCTCGRAWDARDALRRVEKHLKRGPDHSK